MILNMMNILIMYRKYQGFFVVFGGFLLNLTIGNLYTYNNMAPNIVNFMNNYSYSNGSVNEGNAVWIFGMGIFGMGSSITLGSIFIKKLGPSVTVLLAGWLMSVTVLLMYWTLKTYLWVVALTYGFINGVASGIVYGVTIDTACNWFPRRKGTASGCIVAGFGLSAFIIDLVQSKIMDSNVALSYIYIGCAFLVLQFIGALLQRNPPLQETQSLISENWSDLLGLSKEEEYIVNIKPHRIFVEFDFWIIWFTYSLLSACFALVISLHTAYGLRLNIPDGKLSYLTIASSAGSLCNALGRLLWGFIIDKFRYKIVMLILATSLAALLGTFSLPVYILKYNETNNPPTFEFQTWVIVFYYIWVMLLYLIPSGIFAIFPYLCAKLFGQKHFVANYGILFSAYSFGGLITSCITTVIWSQDVNSVTLHIWSFNSGCVMAALAALVTLLYRGRSLINDSTKMWNDTANILHS